MKRVSEAEDNVHQPSQPINTTIIRRLSIDKLSFGLIIFFTTLSLLLTSLVFFAFISLQSLSALTNKQLALWTSISRNIEYISTRTEAGTLNEIAIRGLQRRLKQLLDEEDAVALELEIAISRSSFFWNIIVRDEGSIERIKHARIDAVARDLVYGVSLADPNAVHSSLSYWPTELAVTIRGQITDSLRSRQELLDEALPNGLSTLWAVLAFIFLTLVVSLISVWKYFMQPTLQSLHRSQKKLLSEQKKLWMVLDHVPGLICRVGAEMRMQTVNATFTKEFSWAGDLTNRHIGDVLGAENWKVLEPCFHAALNGDPTNRDIKIGNSVGKKTYEISLVPEDHHNGRGRGIYVMIVDINVRHKAERMLRRSEENLSITLNSIGDAVIAIDEVNCITQFNRVAEELTKKSRAEVLGKSLNEVARFWNSDIDEEHFFLLDRGADNAGDYRRSLNLELFRCGKPNIPLAFSFAHLRNRSSEVIGAVIVLRDVSKERILRNKAHHNDKMATIGQLAGGVAHDFNNILAGLMGSLDLLSETQSISISKEGQQLVDSMLRNVQRASELTQKLTAFAGVDELIFKKLDFSQLLDDTLQIAQETADRRIQFEFKPHSEPLFVNGSASALQAVLLNVVINAIQAMPNGGRLTIRLRTEMSGKSVIVGKSFDLREGPYVVLSISDTGIGIDAENLEKVFDPFFTTKSNNGGTGLGLSAAYSTLKDHAGAIEVTSKLGFGSTFDIYLPESEASTEDVQILPQDKPAPNLSGTEKILVVDDEEEILKINTTYLERTGYHVLTAADGQRAVEVFDEYSDEIDLVLLDMNIPILNGNEVYKHIKRVSPQSPVIVSTGFSSNQGLDSIVDEGVTLLRKPYRLSELLNAVKGALNKSPTL